MVISELLWGDDRVAHIAKHRIAAEEFEEVCFGASLVLRSKAEGPNPVYQVLGRTDAGRYLLCVLVSFPDGRGYPVTAREMTAAEKQRYSRWKRT